MFKQKILHNFGHTISEESPSWAWKGSLSYPETSICNAIHAQYPQKLKKESKFIHISFRILDVFATFADV